MAKTLIHIAGSLPKNFELGRAELKKAAQAFAAKSARRSGSVFREVTIVLQDDILSDSAHRAVMDVEGATDVITQGFDAMPGEPEGVYGELYVNAERAAKAAPKKSTWSKEKELLLYIAHGMDHLSGEDDSSPKDYARMRSRELRWIKEYETEKNH
jgi:probable rRNA maturation factor